MTRPKWDINETCKCNIHPFTCSLKLISNGINEWNVSFSYFGMPSIRFRWHIDGAMQFVKALAVESHSSCSGVGSNANESSSASLIRRLSWARGCWEMSVFHFRLIYLTTQKKEKQNCWCIGRKFNVQEINGNSYIHVWIFYCLKLFGEIECLKLCENIMGNWVHSVTDLPVNGKGLPLSLFTPTPCCKLPLKSGVGWLT